jgi:IS5 family transposase
MLGRQKPQMDLADAVLWTGKIEPKPLVEKGSFHDRFAAVRATLLRDEDFGHWFDAEQGRRSIPPSVVAGAFLLALREGCSDREAEQRMRYDLRWKWALDLGLDDAGCDHSSLCVFRARLLAHEEEDQLFKGLLEKAVEAGLLTKRAVQVMDSSPMLGAAAVQDTYKLIRTALHKLVKGHKRELPAELMPRLKRYLQTGKADIDWEDREARRQELQRLVADAALALKELPADADKPAASAARALLERVAGQDVESDDEGGVKIREGVAKDRVISTVDPEMRHGHKSSAGRWDGYKKHVSEDPDTELITAVEVSAANVGDGQVAMKLLEQQAEAGLEPAEVVADQQYAAGELREQAQSHGEGTSLVTKAAALPNDGYLHKSEFEIDLEAGTVTCPAGEVAHFAGRFRPGHSTEAMFAAATCGRCPFAIACVRTPGQGRTVSIHPYEHQLQAAAERRQRSDFPALMAKRPAVERKQAHLNRKGASRSRYFGLHKTRLQLFWSATVVNIERLMAIGQAVSSLGAAGTAPA